MMLLLNRMPDIGAKGRDGEIERMAKRSAAEVDNLDGHVNYLRTYGFPPIQEDRPISTTFLDRKAADFMAWFWALVEEQDQLVNVTMAAAAAAPARVPPTGLPAWGAGSRPWAGQTSTTAQPAAKPFEARFPGLSREHQEVFCDFIEKWMDIRMRSMTNTTIPGCYKDAPEEIFSIKRHINRDSGQTGVNTPWGFITPWMVRIKAISAIAHGADLEGDLALADNIALVNRRHGPARAQFFRDAFKVMYGNITSAAARWLGKFLAHWPDGADG